MTLQESLPDILNNKQVHVRNSHTLNIYFNSIWICSIVSEVII